ncbi:MAG: isochorismatase family protein [Bdellovibrionales bacterium]
MIKGIRSLLLTLLLLRGASGLAYPACRSDSGGTALIIIDMQPFYIKRHGDDSLPSNRVKVERMMNEQLAVIHRAKQANIPIIFVEYELRRNDVSPADRETSRVLQDAVADYPDVTVVKKTTDSMFHPGNRYRDQLVNVLQERKIGTLIVTGANGGACVNKSIEGALENNCNVIVYNKSIADFNFRRFLYPYVGNFPSYPVRCRNCAFHEVSSIDALTAAMMNHVEKRPYGASPPPRITH